MLPTISRQQQRHLALEAGEHNRLANRHLLSRCRRFRLDRIDASRIVDDIQRTVTNRWREVVRAAGGNEADCSAIASAFDYPGFEYDPRTGRLAVPAQLIIVDKLARRDIARYLP